MKTLNVKTQKNFARDVRKTITANAKIFEA